MKSFTLNWAPSLHERQILNIVNLRPHDYKCLCFDFAKKQNKTTNKNIQNKAKTENKKQTNKQTNNNNKANEKLKKSVTNLIHRSLVCLSFIVHHSIDVHSNCFSWWAACKISSLVRRYYFDSTVCMCNYTNKSDNSVLRFTCFK